MILNVRKTILEKYKLPNDKSANATKMSTIFQELPRVWLEMIGIVGLLAVVSIMIYLDREMDEIIPVIGLFALAALTWWIMPSSDCCPLNKVFFIKMELLRFWYRNDLF